MSLASDGYSLFEYFINENERKKEKQSNSNTIAGVISQIQKILKRRLFFYVTNDVKSATATRLCNLDEELEGMQQLIEERNVNKFTEVYAKNVDMVEKLIACIVCRQKESRHDMLADRNNALQAWETAVRRFRRVLKARNQAERLENFI